jgi:apolipoprotein D and lipocalin family protein
MYCRAILAAIALFVFAGCSSVPRPPVPLVAQVDLDRFMGDWYVIASIPTYIERDAWNAVESYRLDDDGTIATTFTFRKGGFDGPEKRYTPRGFVFDRSSNAVWGMQFVWPIKADYRIAYLSEDYGQTVIAREARDYVWIMARSPSLSDADYARLETFVASMGYDTTQLRKVPQRWPAPPRAQGHAP